MKRTVEITYLVEVETDDSKFDENFINEFRDYFYDFDTIEEHVEHLAQLEVRELLFDNFTEGYGKLEDMGIKAKIVSSDAIIIEG